MNRLNQLHLAARMDLPSTVSESEQGRSTLGRRLFSPAACEILGLLGFACCGAAVIVAANLLALQVN